MICCHFARVQKGPNEMRLPGCLRCSTLLRQTCVSLLEKHMAWYEGWGLRVVVSVWVAC